MTLPLTGAISMSNVRTELSRSDTISLNQTDVRTLLQVPSGQIALSNARGKSVDPFVKSTSGYYTVTTAVGDATVWIDNSYDGGGWVQVISNTQNTNGLAGLLYNNAINRSNYRANGMFITPTLGNPLNGFNAFVGLKFWPYLAGRKTSGKITVVQFVSATKGAQLSQTSLHVKRFRWQFDS